MVGEEVRKGGRDAEARVVKEKDLHEGKGEREKEEEEEELGSEEGGPGVGAGDPELAVADEGFVVDEARDEDEPGDGYEETQTLRRWVGGRGSDGGGNAPLAGSGPGERGGEREDDEDLRVEVTDIFAEDVEGEVHERLREEVAAVWVAAWVADWVDAWVRVDLAKARKMARRLMGSSSMAEAPGKSWVICAWTGSVSAREWMKRRTEGLSSGSSQVAGVGGGWSVGAGCEGYEDFAEAIGEGGDLVGEEETAAIEEADVGGDGFDLGEVVGRDEDGGRVVALREAVEEAFGEFVADEGVEAGEGFVEDDEAGVKGKDAEEGGLHALAAGEVLQLAMEGYVELLDELLFEGKIPRGGRRDGGR